MRSFWKSLAIVVLLGLMQTMFTDISAQIIPGIHPLAPRITQIDFPSRITSDGELFSATIHFEAPDADVDLIEITVQTAESLNGGDIRDITDIQDISWNPRVNGLEEGIITFQIKTEFTQFAVLSIALRGSERGFGPSQEFSWYSLASYQAHELWRFDTSSPIWATPAIGLDGAIHVGTVVGSFFAVNSDGTLKWRLVAEGGIDLNSAPAIDDNDNIYLCTSSIPSGFSEIPGYLYSLNPDGTEKWQIEKTSSCKSPAIGEDGTIYFSANLGLIATTPEGEEKWRFTSLPISSSSPSIASDGTVYVAGGEMKFYAINPDGSLKWETELDDFVTVSPGIGSDGTIYVGTQRGNFVALNPDGSEKWSLDTARTFRASPSIAADGTIYIGTSRRNFSEMSNFLYAINPDGILKWRFLIPDDMDSSPAIGLDGTIYVGSSNNNLYAINPDGTLKWRFETDGPVRSSPIIGSDGVIYFGSEDGYLYALIDTNTGLAQSPWPSFRNGPQNTGRQSPPPAE